MKEYHTASLIMYTLELNGGCMLVRALHRAIPTSATKLMSVIDTLDKDQDITLDITKSANADVNVVVKLHSSTKANWPCSKAS